MQVQDFMTSDVSTLSPDSTAYEAWETILSERVRQLPVVEDGEVKGIVSRTDLLRNAQHLDFDSAYDQQVPIEEVMTNDPKMISPDADLEEAASVMHEHRLSSLPVTDGEYLVGILSKTDMFRAMTKMVKK